MYRTSVRTLRLPQAIAVSKLTALFMVITAVLALPVIQAQTLKLRLPFDESAGSTTTASDTSGGGAAVTLNIVNGANAAADLHGPAGSGVEANGRALDFTTGSAAGNTAGPLVSAVNQANLGFGLVTNFTATIWFKQSAIFNNVNNQGPRLWCIGANGTTDSGAANSLSVQYFGFAPGNAHRQVALRLGADNPTVGTAFPATPFLPTNIWQFLACVYDGTNAMIYAGTETSPARLIAIQTSLNRTFDFGTSGSVMIGNRISDRLRSYAGWIDDFRFYVGAGDATFIENVRKSSTPMVFTGTFPDGLRLMEGTNTLAFNVASTSGVDTNSLKVAVNGSDVSSSLVFSGTTNNLTVLYNGLPVNSAPTVAVPLAGVTYSLRVADASGLVASNTVTYDAFAPTNFTWEAEEWDFTNGMYLDGATYSSVDLPNSYFGLMGTVDVDYHDQTGAGTHYYRANDTMSTLIVPGTPGDFLNPRMEAAIANDLAVRVVDIENFFGGANVNDSEWVNYTRTYPTGLYNVYARLSSGGASAATLSTVTNGWGTASQETSTLGTFTLNTGSIRVFNYVPLLDTNGILVKLALNGTNTLRLRRVFGTATDCNPDFLMLVPANTNLPAITDVYPDGATQFQTTNRLSFVASTATGVISTNGVRVTLSVTNVSAHFTTNLTSTNGLLLTGSTASWNVSYSGLITNAAYVAVITVSDAVNNSATLTKTFDTYNPSFTWEAEDYDYSNGAFTDNPQTNDYAGRAGTLDVDFHDGALTPQAQAYRYAGDTMATEANGDRPRRPYVGSGLTDYNVGWFDGGDWGNYSRTFPAGDYNVFARVANGQATASGSATLSRVTNGWGTASQAVTTLGTVSIPPTTGWQTYTWLPFRDSGGNLVKFSGGNTNTLRVTSGGGLNANLYMLLPANTNLPTITQLYPDGLAFFQSTNRLSFSVGSAAGINTNSIVVTLNGVTASNLVIIGSSSSWNVSYSKLQPNTEYTAVITVTDANGNVATTAVRFNTFSSANFTWEAEDYDHDSGQFIDNPQTNAYFGLPGTFDVDYHELFANVPQLIYRTSDSMGTAVVGDVLRPQYIGTNDYHVGWFTTGEWINFTRTFPAGQYYAYARLARGTTGAAAPVLSKVEDGWGTTTQATNDLGSFTVNPTGGWQSYTWTPLRDGSGNLVVLDLGGTTNTLRLTSAGPEGNTEVNINCFMLVSPLTLNASQSGGNLNLSFLTQSGFSYQIQYKTDLTDLIWANLGSSVVGDGSIKTVSDPTIAARRFYRLSVQ